MRALEILECAYGPNHRTIAVTLTNLGIAYGNLGDAKTKRDLLERALVIKKREYGSDHRSVAITLINLGNVYGELGDVENQRDVLERALVINQREYGVEYQLTKGIQKQLQKLRRNSI